MWIRDNGKMIYVNDDRTKAIENRFDPALNWKLMQIRRTVRNMKLKEEIGGREEEIFI